MKIKNVLTIISLALFISCGFGTPLGDDSLPEITTYRSVDYLRLGTKVRVESSPYYTVDFWPYIDEAFIRTDWGTGVFIEFKNDISEWDERKYESSRKPIRFEGYLDSKYLITIIDAQVVR